MKAVTRFLLRKHRQPQAEEPADPANDTGPSVAVLPFINMSGDADNEYFSDGLTETLLHMLAQLPELRVAARTSSFAFKGQRHQHRGDLQPPWASPMYLKAVFKKRVTVFGSLPS